LDGDNCLSEIDFLAYMLQGIVKESIIVDTIVGNSIIDPMDH